MTLDTFCNLAPLIMTHINYLKALILSRVAGRGAGNDPN